MVGTADRSALTIAQAKRNRIAESSRKSYSSGRNQVKKWLRLVGNYECLMPTVEEKDGETLDLTIITYDDFLHFLTWIVRNKTVEATTLMGYRSAVTSLYRNQGIALPVGYGDDMKEVFSGMKLPNIFHTRVDVCNNTR